MILEFWFTNISIAPWLIAFKVLINNVSVIVLLHAYIILQKFEEPEDGLSKKLIFGLVLASIFIFLSQIFIVTHLHIPVEKGFHMFSGICNALLLSLLIGKLDSEVIGASSLVIASLFMYAAIQPMFYFFAGENLHIKIIILYSVIFLKIFFYFFLMWVIRENLLIKYFLFSFKVNQCIHDDNKIIDEALINKLLLYR
jgi:hypothetical protein